jgi:hypothetical protein
MVTALASTGNAGSSSAATWTPAVAIAVCALLFTVLSFWWLNVRRGKLKSFQPFSFAAVLNTDLIRIRLPIVFHNTGAAPIVIQNLRIAFPDEPNAKPLPWVAARSHIKPEEKDGHAFPAVFSVPGRTAIQTFQEFGAKSLGFKLRAKSYRIRLEAKLGHKEEWQSIVNFTLEACRIEHPENFITYDNSPSIGPDEKREEIQIGLAFAQISPMRNNTNNDSQ